MYGNCGARWIPEDPKVDIAISAGELMSAALLLARD